MSELAPTPTEHAFLGHRQGHADIDELADFYRHLAEAEFAGYCELYATLARAVAADEAMLERVAAMAPAAKIIPVLLFAAVHDRVLADPGSALAAIYRGEPTAPADPYPTFRTFVVEHHDELAAVVRTRSIQTNEVGRSAILACGLTAVQRRFGRPVAMIEIGPSAGLNLFADRFGYRYARAADDPIADRFATPVTLGPVDAGVQLSCEVRGPLAPPLDDAVPAIGHRAGIDLAPVDVRDDEACRWLEACLWPQIPQRAERLRAAIALARTDPPTLVRGDVFTDLAALVEAVPEGLVPVVTSTWVLAYFSRDDRTRVGELLDAIGATRDLALLTAEYPSIAPGIERPTRPATDPSGQAATLIGLTTWLGGERRAAPLAWAQAHGRWLDWVDVDTAGTA